MKCFILDDEPLAVALLKDYVEKMPSLELVGATTSSIEALEQLHHLTVDLVFIDIQMPDLTGLQIMEMLGNKSKFIITSAYNQYALKGYEYNVIDYLMKPISFERFYKSVLKAKDLIQPIIPVADLAVVDQNDSFLFVKTDGRFVRIVLNDLQFVEGMKDYLMLHLINERLIILETLKDFEQKLDPTHFMRVHKSYIVRLDQIETIERNRIFMGDKIIPVGDTYKEQFHQWMQRLK